MSAATWAKSARGNFEHGARTLREQLVETPRTKVEHWYSGFLSGATPTFGIWPCRRKAGQLAPSRITQQNYPTARGGRRENMLDKCSPFNSRPGGAAGKKPENTESTLKNDSRGHVRRIFRVNGHVRPKFTAFGPNFGSVKIRRLLSKLYEIEQVLACVWPNPDQIGEMRANT